jgi:hypothetical protein
MLSILQTKIEEFLCYQSYVTESPEIKTESNFDDALVLKYCPE